MIKAITKFLLIFLFSLSAQAKQFTFNYKFQNQTFKIVVEGKDWETAYKTASKECFNALTGGKYPGEELGLDIIDTCANPKQQWGK